MSRKGKKKNRKNKAIMHPYTRYQEVELNDMEEDIPPGYERVYLSGEQPDPLVVKVVKDSRSSRERTLERLGLVSKAQLPAAARHGMKVSRTLPPAVRVGIKGYQKSSPLISAAVKASVSGPRPTQEVFVAGSRGRGIPVFTPSLQSMMDTYRLNPVFREQLLSGKYVYVNGAFCLNQSEYVTIDPMAGAAITPYAKRNAAECMLQFGVRSRPGRYGKRPPAIKGGFHIGIPGVGHPFGSRDRFGGAVYTRRGVPYGGVVLPGYLSGGETVQAGTKAEKNTDTIYRSFASIADVKTVYDKVSKMDTLGAVMTELMTELGVSKGELAELADMDETRIKRIRNDSPEAAICKEDLLAIVVGLRIPPPLGKFLFDISGIHLRENNKEEFAYIVILSSMYMCSLKAVNERLKQESLPSIPKHSFLVAEAAKGKKKKLQSQQNK